MKGEPNPRFHNSHKPQRHLAFVEDVAISGVIQPNLHVGWNIILGPEENYGMRVFQHISKGSHGYPEKRRESGKQRNKKNPGKEDVQRKVMATYR